MIAMINGCDNQMTAVATRDAVQVSERRLSILPACRFSLTRILSSFEAHLDFSQAFTSDTQSNQI